MVGAKEYTLKANIESYATIYLGYEGEEVSSPKPMTLKQANYLTGVYGGYVVKL